MENQIPKAEINNGFLPGPIEIDEETGNNIGGDHVRYYNEFLELFGLVPPQNLYGRYAATTLWPMPGDGLTIERNSLLLETELSSEEQTGLDKPYYMIDDVNNIIMPGRGENEGWFIQTGWFWGMVELLFIFILTSSPQRRSTAKQVK